MHSYKPKYFIKQAFISFARNKALSVTSIAVLVACLVIMGSFSTLLYVADYNLENLDSLDSVIVFIKDGNDVSDVAAKLETPELAKYIESYTVITKEEALEQQKEKYSEHIEIFEPLGNDNPLPDAIEIKYNGSESLNNLLVRLRNLDGIEDNIKNNHEVADRISELKDSVTVTFIGVWVLVVIVTLLVTFSTINLSVHSRLTEIEVMRYIGAANWFISLPFVIESFIIAVIAFIIAFPIQWYIYDYMFVKFVEDISYITVPTFGSIAPAVALGFILGELMIGLLASLLSVNKHLHK